MNKIAVIISGEFRTYSEVSKFWNFSENVDVYFSTWETSTEERITWVDLNLKTKQLEYNFIPPKFSENIWSPLTISDTVDVKENYFKEFKNRHKGKTYIDIVSDRSKPLLPLYFDAGNTPNMIYHWKNGLKMIRHTLTADSDLNYSAICLLRIDSFQIFDEEAIIKQIKMFPISISTPSNDEDIQNEYVNDIGFFGNFQIMSKFIENLNPVKHYKTHNSLGRYIKEGVHKGDWEHKQSNLCHSFSLRLGAVPFIRKVSEIIFGKYGNRIYDLNHHDLVQGLDVAGTLSKLHKFTSPLPLRYKSQTEDEYYKQLNELVSKTKKEIDTLINLPKWKNKNRCENIVDMINFQISSHFDKYENLKNTKFI